MRKTLFASAIMTLGLGGAPAEAMPFGSLHVAPPRVTLVAMGCGPGWTRGPYGHCHPIGAYYGYHPYYHPYYYHPYYYHPYYYHRYYYHPYYHPYYHHYYHRYWHRY